MLAYPLTMDLDRVEDRLQAMRTYVDVPSHALQCGVDWLIPLGMPGSAAGDNQGRQGRDFVDVLGPLLAYSANSP